MKFILYMLFIALFILSCSGDKSQIKTEKMEMKIVGGIHLPISLEPKEILEDWLPNGDGYLIHRYSIEKSIYNEVFNQLKNESAHDLPFEDDVFIDNLIYEFVDDTDQGVYKLINDEEDHRDMMLIVLNGTKMELIIMHSRQ